MKLIERIIRLPALAQSEQVRADLATLARIGRAEEAAKSGLRGARLDRLIDHLRTIDGQAQMAGEIEQRIHELPCVIADVGYR